MERWGMYQARISLLWVLEALAYLIYVDFVLLAPGTIDQVRSGTLAGTSLESASYVFALLFFVIMIMVFLTMSLGYSTNRWGNIAVGAVIAILEFAGMTQSLSNVYGPVLLIWATKVVIAVSVVWFAYRWPKPTT